MFNSLGDEPADDAADLESAEPAETTEDSGTQNLESDAEPADLEEDSEFANPESEESDEPARGTEDNPIPIVELDEQMFVRVKIDGQEETVHLREAANGIIRQRSFSRRVNELNEMRPRFEKAVEAAEQRVKRVEQSALGLFQNPKQLDEYMERHYPDQWEAAARLKARRYQEVLQMSEAERLEYHRQRDRERYQRELAAARKQADDAQKSVREQREQEEIIERISDPFRQALAEVGPARLDQAAKKKAFRAAAQILEAEETDGRKLSADELREVFALTLSRYAAPVEPQPDSPAPAAPPRRVAPRKRRSRAATPLKESPDGTWDFSHLKD